MGMYIGLLNVKTGKEHPDYRLGKFGERRKLLHLPFQWDSHDSDHEDPLFRPADLEEFRNAVRESDMECKEFYLEMADVMEDPNYYIDVSY